MESKTDMTYSFLWDTEPTDEQLETLMQEVAEEVRRKKAIAEENFRKTMQEELRRAKAAYQIQTKQ
ncbi:MAG: hypothetical protein LBT50_06590 [Prevotellaceae bacterium]|jgi:hypothetical protein|nr:hypothetical protein [Prevotellaceae bacterium]